MWWILPVVLATSPTQEAIAPPTSAPEVQQHQIPSQDIEDCQEGVKGLKNDVIGLEFFLQDKKDYKESCPSAKWEQPKLEEYKKDPKSYLPKDCKVEKI